MRIIAAAIRVNGLTVSLPPPARHHTILKLLDETHRKFANAKPSDQGFVADDGSFVGREDAKRVAIAAGQMKVLTPHKELFSEDLW